MNDDPYAERRRLTFEQAEGVEPLPTQLKTKELSQELRAVLWKIIYESLCRCEQYGVLSTPWDDILEDEWIFHRNRMVDEFSIQFTKRAHSVKIIIERGDYFDVLGFVQFVLRHELCPSDFPDSIERALRFGQAAYRVLDRTTLVPIASDHDAETIERAFSDLEQGELHGARSHLRLAGSQLTSGDYAASIRESIHAVESVVCLVSDSSDLKKAINKLAGSAPIHGALKSGFLAIYGYTSDERGIRHSLLDQKEAPVDEVDAMFMMGACAAFVSYLINKARNAGLLERKSIDEVANNVDGRNECGHDGE